MLFHERCNGVPCGDARGAEKEQGQRRMKAFFAYFSLGRSPDSRLNLSRAIGSTIARQILSGVLHFIALWIITRQLGPEKNGILATVLLLPYTLHALLNFGLGAGHAYFVSKGTGDYKGMRTVNWVLAAGLWLAITASLFACSDEFIRQYLPGIEKDLALYAALLVPLMLLATWSSSLIQGSRDYDEYNKLLLLHPVVFCCGILFLNALNSVTVISVLTSYLLSYLAFWLLSEWKIGKLKPFQAATKSTSFDSLRFGLKAHLSNVITFLNYRIDLYIVSYMLGAIETGQYNLSMQLAERLWLISYAASVIVFPEAAAHTARPAELHKMTKKIAGTVFTVTLVGALVTALLSPFAIPWIFGNEYQGAVMPFIIMLPGIVLWSYMRIVSNALAGLGYLKVNNWSAVICLAVNIAANLIAVPLYGANGAALASTIAYSVATVYTVMMYRRVMEEKIRDFESQAARV